MRTILCCSALVLAAACSGTPAATTPPDVPPDCARPVSPSALSGAQVLVHGSHTAGDTVSFTVPPGTGSLTIVHQAQNANLKVVFNGTVVDNSAVPGVILKPDGSKAYDDNDRAFGAPSSPDGGIDPSGIYSFFGGGSPSTSAFTIPNTSASLDAGVPSGTWQFQVNDYAYECAQPNSGCSDGGASGNTYDVMVLVKPAPPATPTLDLAFYIVANVIDPPPPLGTGHTGTGTQFTAANAVSDPSAQRMVSTFTSLYSSVGIKIGKVTFYDVDPAAVTRFGTSINADTTGPCDELDQMFLLSAAHPGNTLNLFLVQSITSKSSSGGSVVGIDGTIPGPATLSGTVHSGAAVSLADLFRGASNCTGGPDLSCGADEVAFIGAHEAGHFLGLFHTTEADGRDFDPLTDTAKCPCISCAKSTDLPNCSTGGSSSNPIFLASDQCSGVSAACGGGDNLMFWQLGSASLGKLTPQQAAVMSLSPVVH